VAVLVKDLSPGVVTGAFSVNDEAVEVEDHGANGWGHGLWSADESSASQHLFLPTNRRCSILEDALYAKTITRTAA
jgi:hypothetical protein